METVFPLYFHRAEKSHLNRDEEDSGERFILVRWTESKTETVSPQGRDCHLNTDGEQNGEKFLLVRWTRSKTETEFPFSIPAFLHMYMYISIINLIKRVLFIIYLFIVQLHFHQIDYLEIIFLFTFFKIKIIL